MASLSWPSGLLAFWPSGGSAIFALDRTNQQARIDACMELLNYLHQLLESSNF